MNSVDREILEMLKKNETVKAPDDFTVNVMESVMQIESSRSNTFKLSNLMLSLLILFSMVASLFVFYYFDNSFFDGIMSTFTVVNGTFSNLFSWLNIHTLSFLSLAKDNSFVIGLILTILLLLSFDKLFLSRKVNVNILSVV